MLLRFASPLVPGAWVKVGSTRMMSGVDEGVAVGGTGLGLDVAGGSALSVGAAVGPGIVWIPGLRAGMILSGTDPLYAAVYQFVVIIPFSDGCGGYWATASNGGPLRVNRSSPLC